MSMYGYTTSNRTILSMLFRLGFTEVIISDQGREFVNKVNEEFMALAGVMGSHTWLHIGDSFS